MPFGKHISRTWSPTGKWVSGRARRSRRAPTHRALLPHGREVNLKGSSSLLCVGACICESPAWFTVDGAVQLTLQEMLMWGAWDCFKVVKRDQSPEDEVNPGYCALLPDECGRHRDEDNRSPAIFSLLWWMCYKNPTQPWVVVPKFNPSAVFTLYRHFGCVCFVENGPENHVYVYKRWHIIFH